MELNFGLNVLFDTKQDWKEIQAKAEEVNSTKAYHNKRRNFPLNFQRVFHKLSYK
jgi:hypothetical protein